MPEKLPSDAAPVGHSTRNWLMAACKYAVQYIGQPAAAGLVSGAFSALGALLVKTWIG